MKIFKVWKRYILAESKVWYLKLSSVYSPRSAIMQGIIVSLDRISVIFDAKAFKNFKVIFSTLFGGCQVLILLSTFKLPLEALNLFWASNPKIQIWYWNFAFFYLFMIGSSNEHSVMLHPFITLDSIHIHIFLKYTPLM